MDDNNMVSSYLQHRCVQQGIVGINDQSRQGSVAQRLSFVKRQFINECFLYERQCSRRLIFAENNSLIEIENWIN